MQNASLDAMKSLGKTFYSDLLKLDRINMGRMDLNLRVSLRAVVKCSVWFHGWWPKTFRVSSRGQGWDRLRTPAEEITSLASKDIMLSYRGNCPWCSLTLLEIQGICKVVKHFLKITWFQAIPKSEFSFGRDTHFILVHWYVSSRKKIFWRGSVVA